MNNEKLTIFLSHSHKDVEKVRKIRDILEIIGCEPLMFFLKCLDDDNDKLEDFIKREIDARNIFLYCKSKNSERSVWVQKELEYIKSLDESRLYEVDIDNDFSSGTVSLLNGIMNLIKKNRVFISCLSSDLSIEKKISQYLQQRGLQVFDFLKIPLGCYFYDAIKSEIKKAAEEGVFIILVSKNFIKGKHILDEIRLAEEYGADILPVVVNGADLKEPLPFLNIKESVYIDEDPTEEQLKKVYEGLFKL